MRRSSRSVVVCFAVLGVGCGTALGPTAEPPLHCQTMDEWHAQQDVYGGRVIAQGTIDWLEQQPFSAVSHELIRMERARIDREDHLEAYCLSVNAYRRALK